jgi:hypothetical protein
MSFRPEGEILFRFLAALGMTEVTALKMTVANYCYPCHSEQREMVYVISTGGRSLSRGEILFRFLAALGMTGGIAVFILLPKFKPFAAKRVANPFYTG